MEDRQNLSLGLYFYFINNIIKTALASVAQLGGVSSLSQRVVDLIPDQGAYLGCVFGPLSRCILEATN